MPLHTACRLAGNRVRWHAAIQYLVDMCPEVLENVRENGERTHLQELCMRSSPSMVLFMALAISEEEVNF